MTWTVLHFSRPSGVLARESIPQLPPPDVYAPKEVLSRHSVWEYSGRFPPRGRSSRDMLLALMVPITAEKKHSLDTSLHELSLDEQAVIEELLRTERIIIAAQWVDNVTVQFEGLGVLMSAYYEKEGVSADLAYHLAVCHGTEHADIVDMMGSVIAHSYVQTGQLDREDIAAICHYLIDPQSPKDLARAFREGWDMAFNSADDTDKCIAESPENAALEAMMIALDDESLDTHSRAYYQECCAYILMMDSAPKEALEYLLGAIRLGRIYARPYLADIYCELKDFSSACEALWQDFWDTASLDSLIRFTDIARQYSLYSAAAEWAHTELEFLYAEQLAHDTRSRTTTALFAAK